MSAYIYLKNAQTPIFMGGGGGGYLWGKTTGQFYVLHRSDVHYLKNMKSFEAFCS